MTIVLAVAILGFGAGAEASAFDEVMEHYEPARQALLEDSMKNVNENGAAMATALRALKTDFSEDRAGTSGDAAMVVREKLGEMIAAADDLAKADGLQTARDAFYELSKPLVRWREGVAAESRPAVAYCPMHKRSWLQPDGEIGNPYGGMPRCGEIVSN
jgi:hypothetical protein